MGGSLTELKVKLICHWDRRLNPVQWGPHTRTSHTVRESVASPCIKGSIPPCQKVLGFICKGRYLMNLAAHNEKGETLSPVVLHEEFFVFEGVAFSNTVLCLCLLTPIMVASKRPRHHSLWSNVCILWCRTCSSVLLHYLQWGGQRTLKREAAVHGGGRE